VDVVKTVFMASEVSDAVLVRQIAESQETKVVLKKKPLIAIAAGETGKISRVLNQFMTPVTHPSFGVSAAPGQMSVTDIKFIRQTLSIK